MSRISSLLASELFAMSQSACCEGKEECHWCGAPCGRTWTHNDNISPPYIRVKAFNPNRASRPGNSYVCIGCWLWRRPRISLQLLETRADGAVAYVDGQCAINHSWWITEDSAWIVKPKHYPTLYKFLLNPPKVFCLALLDGDKEQNHIHLAVTNDMMGVNKSTPLRFTINNTVYAYCVLELESALQKGIAGREPGAQALVKLLGKKDAGLEEKKGRGVGRPRSDEDGKSSKEIVHCSGDQELLTTR